MTHLDHYPFVDRQEGKCVLWRHHKAVVRWLPESRVERYDCECGKYYWLSSTDGTNPLTRFRASR